MEALLVIEQENTSEQHYYLDPVITPSEISSAYLKESRRPGYTLITGFVTDEAGNPLDNAKLYSRQRGVQTFSNEEGFFQLWVPARVLANDYLEACVITIEKAGYVTQVHNDVMIWSEGDWIYNMTLNTGSGIETTNDSKYDFDALGNIEGLDEKQSKGFKDHARDALSRTSSNKSLTCSLPANVRVGTNCTNAFNCSTFSTYTLNYYTKAVLAHEWIPSWGNTSSGLESLKAGAVAVRSYGSWYTDHPLTSNYDICGTTFCQVFVNSTSTNTNTAVDATIGWVVTEGGGPARSEFSSEDNHLGPQCATSSGSTMCGNGFVSRSNTGSTCHSDVVCTNHRINGHGRGMCQYGTWRWATGINQNGACTNGTGNPHGQGAQNWQFIVDHYYPYYARENCTCPSTIITTDVISSGNILTHEANSSIIMNHGFHAQLGSSYYAGIIACAPGKNSVEQAEASPILPSVVFSENRRLHCYPNPSDNELSIEFSIEQKEVMSLVVYDQLGRKYAVAFELKEMEAGSYRLQINVEEWLPGFYYCEASTLEEKYGQNTHCSLGRIVDSNRADVHAKSTKKNANDSYHIKHYIA